MKAKILYPVWGVLYIICVLLGAIPQPHPAAEVALAALSLLFFVPAGLLLADAWKTRNHSRLKQLCIISACSLGLTLLALVGNFLSVFCSELAGDILYILLLAVSAPMLCCPYWALSLLLWAILFFTALTAQKKQL